MSKGPRGPEGSAGREGPCAPRPSRGHAGPMFRTNRNPDCPWQVPMVSTYWNPEGILAGQEVSENPENRICTNAGSCGPATFFAEHFLESVVT